MSCGCDPPAGRYRWPKRICTQCRVSLDTKGYVTEAGRQVQSNLQVPTCYPGMVRVQGEQYPPAKKKWDTVVTKEGQVEIDLGLALLDRPGMEKPKKWVHMQKEDLAKLIKPDPPRFTHALAGIGLSGARPMVSANTSYNKAKALFGRMFRAPSRKPWGQGPKPGVWKWARQFVDELLPHFIAHSMSVEEWLDSMPSRRRVALEQAYERYKRAGWMESYKKFCAFVKTELLPGFSKTNCDLDRMVEMLDRLIQGPHDCTHVIAGPELKPLVKLLKKVWHSENAIFYGSTSPEQLHLWLQGLVSQGGTYFWSDFAMFDNTHSKESWGFMKYLYSRAGINAPDFWRVMKAWEKPTGKIGPMRYKANVMNASGRDDTALANGILNGVATFLSTAAALLNKPLQSLTISDVRKARSEIRLSVCGDDSLGSVPTLPENRVGQFRQAVIDNISEFGFEAKLFMSDRLSDAVYLGMRPYPTRKGWFWGKTIGRATYKMGWVLLKGDRDVMAHITGIADMHTLCSSHVPVLADLARKITELRVGARRTPVVLDENKPWEWTFQGGVPYDDLTLKAVADAYTVKPTAIGQHEVDQEVTVADVKDLINTIEGIKQLPAVVDHWLWRRMVLSDDL